MYETKVALDNQNIRLSMPLLKVDQERRIVHGFATLDNLDKQDDIVTKSASVRAFERFRGNIREQHDPHKAVGKVVTFKEESIYDQETGKTYSGVLVSAYVSKGAEDTWQKVLDGTLSGFSIGGAIRDTEKAYDEDLDKAIRIIHEYDLVELSLVDNPANQLANIVSIEKLDNGDIDVKTPLIKGDIENIFWCKNDNLVVVKSTEEEHCAVCDRIMDNVGFVESNDIDKRNTIKSSLELFKQNNFTVKEASNVAEDTIVDETVETDAVEADVEKSEDTVEESAPEMEADVEKADEASEAEAEVNEVEKSDEVAEAEAEVVEKDATAEMVDVNNQLVSSLSLLTDAVKTLNDKVEEISKSVQGVKADVAEVKGSSESLGKRVDAVEDTTAFRKSGDLGEVVQEQEIRKSNSPWGGRFLNAADL